MADEADPKKLKSELMGLFQYIQRVKEEIAAINRPADSEHQFQSMSEQLEAIVKATEDATNTIMEAVEGSDEAVAELRKHVDGNDTANKLLDRINESSATIFEACSFQDITGQRVNKITKSLGYVEERVGSIVAIWGADALEDVTVKEAEKSDDEKLLNGPQLEGKGLSQADIDALFD